MATFETLTTKAGKVRGYRIGSRPGGRGTRMQWTPPIAEKSEALKIYAETKAREAATKSMRVGMRIPLIELAERYKTSSINRAVQKGYSDQYIARRSFYQELVRSRLVALFEKRNWITVDDISPEAIEQWQTKCKRTEGVSRILKALLIYARRRCSQPVEEECIALLSPGKKPDKEPGRLMTAEEVAALEQRASVASLDLASLVHFLSTYGSRPITAAALKCRDYNPDCGTLTIEVKNGNRLAFPILPKTAHYFDQQVKGRRPEDPLFIDPRYGEGFAIHARQLQKLNPGQLRRGEVKKDNLGRGFVGFKEPHKEFGHGFGTAGGRDISTFFGSYLGEQSYNLKRFAITTMLDRGMDLKTIMLWTGHTTEAQVAKYSRSNEAKARANMHKLPGGEELTKTQRADQAKAAKSWEEADNAAAAADELEQEQLKVMASAMRKLLGTKGAAQLWEQMQAPKKARGAKRKVG